MYLFIIHSSTSLQSYKQDLRTACENLATDFDTSEAQMELRLHAKMHESNEQINAVSTIDYLRQYQQI